MTRESSSQDRQTTVGEGGRAHGLAGGAEAASGAHGEVAAQVLNSVDPREL